MKMNYFKKLKLGLVLATWSSLTLLTSLEVGAMETGAFEGELDCRIQKFFAHKPVHQEVKEDFDLVVENPQKRGTILRRKFDASYGAADCQTQALLMMSILRTYQNTLFESLPSGVQITLKAMHLFTKYYENKRDVFGLVMGEEKGIEKIVYATQEEGTSCKLIETGLSEKELLQTLGVGLSQTAIANLKRHTRSDLQEEFNYPKLHPELGLPQSLTTLGLVSMFDYMKKNNIPLLLKVTRILGTGVEGKGKKQKGLFKGQKQQLILLAPEKDAHLKPIPQEEWGKYMYDTVFAIRLFAIKCTFQEEHFQGYAEKLHTADSFEDYLDTLADPGFIPFLLAVNATLDDAAHERKPVCPALTKYFDPTIVTYQSAWRSWSCNYGSIPMDTPHIYVTTLHQQLESLKKVESIEVKKKFLNSKVSKSCPILY